MKTQVYIRYYLLISS